MPMAAMSAPHARPLLAGRAVAAPAAEARAVEVGPARATATEMVAAVEAPVEAPVEVGTGMATATAAATEMGAVMARVTDPSECHRCSSGPVGPDRQPSPLGFF